MKPNPHIALIYHYDLARALNGEPVDWQAIPVNVDAGREGGDLCRAAADFGKRRDLFAMPAPSVERACTCGDPNAEGINHHYNGRLCVVVKVAAPAPVPSVAVEQPAVTEVQITADAEVEKIKNLTVDRDAVDLFAVPATASSVVPASAATRDKLRARVAGLVHGYDGAEILLRRYWPDGIPTLKHLDHDANDLEQILAAVRRVEAEVGAGWHPDDDPPPHSRIAIERALAAWADRDPGTAWFAASLIATFEQCRNADATFEQLVGQFTIEQAERLVDAAQGQP